MTRANRLFALLIVSFMILGSMQTQVNAPIDGATPTTYSVNGPMTTSGYDSPNITATLISPNNGSAVSGTFSITINITSDFGPLNLTLFVEDQIYPAYNKTTVGSGNSWQQVLSVDSTTLAEGMLNFTVLLEYNAEKESLYLVYFVDNVSPNFQVALYGPTNESTVSGVFSINLNVTSDYDPLNVTVLVDGTPYAPYNPGLIASGNVSLIIDTSSFWEGWNNITLRFAYHVLEVDFEDTMYLSYLVDNDGVPISIDHQAPANGTEVSGVFDVTLKIGSEYEPLELTLFIDGAIYPAYNQTLIGIHEQNITVDSTSLEEGLLNFTFFLWYNATGEEASATYHLVFEVNNHGAPILEILAPSSEDTVTGVFDLWLNITSTYPELYLNITVDGQMTEEFNGTSIVAGAFNYSINSSCYDNGEYTVGITVYTGEGEVTSTTITLVFLDHVRLYVSGLTTLDVIAGDAEIGIHVETPYDNITVCLYVNGVLNSDIVNVTLYPGSNKIHLNTTLYPDGETTITLRAYDPFGHVYSRSILLVIDNHGPPTLRFATSDDIVVGLAQFTVDVDTTWTTLTVSIYVDDVVVPGYENATVDVSSGVFTFTIDVGAYSKTEHTVKVLMVTPEGDSADVERVFGFATLRIEEIASVIVILVAAFMVPISKWRKGQGIKPVLVTDAVFLLVTAGIFLALGVNTVSFLTWHINLASIWTLGVALIFANWIVPLMMEEEQSK
ncbi:MAG: hypothetical protein DRO87_07135 [Candidatus Thorarchaeota archaeon]|nr:MAG: hypothetical protein DRP09_09190 [Candidatus Thorarchaeota archaeon]RLI57259.1 MAG: hypothetical protein DRO87_07135 [Candidatus Thorarchaeota archaeon]